MPVFPLVGSSSSRPGSSSPEASAASIIALATRSLIDPVGFWPSSLAKMRTPSLGERRCNSTSGVLPTRSSSEVTVRLGTAGHGREEHQGGAVPHGGLQAVEGADVLALEEDVDERRDRLALEHLPAQRRIAACQVVQHLAHRGAVGYDRALAVDGRAERRGDANCRHVVTFAVGAAQNWT